MPVPDDLALVQHDDLVRVQNRAHPLGDDQRRSALHQHVQRLADLRLRLGIDGGGEVVENQDPRVEQECPRDGNTLLLAARERDTALADAGLVAVREPPG